MLFKYNESSISYVKFKFQLKHYLYFVLIQIFIILLSLLSLLLILSLYETPKEKLLKKDLTYLTQEFSNINNRILEAEFLLGQIKQNDSIIYQSIFDTVEINIKQFKTYYEEESINNFSKLVEETNTKISILDQQLAKEQYRLFNLKHTAYSHQEMLLHIPAIQPIDNKDLKRTASGYGIRIDPFYRTKKFHYGLDFSAPSGTPIYATADGFIELIFKESEAGSQGYGNVIIINHDYGYKTLYAHMSNFNLNIKKGSFVKRGTTIGYVGSTGKSTGPHLHYEVRKNNIKINPVNFLFSDLSPSEYHDIIHISNSIQKSFD